MLEVLSCLSYVLMFKPVFCPRMSWRTSYELGMSELAVGSLVPASGAGGLAFGAWALRKGGMPAEDIARRTVAFFVLKSAANFVAVAVLGVVMWLGVGPARLARCSRSSRRCSPSLTIGRGLRRSRHSRPGGPPRDARRVRALAPLAGDRRSTRSTAACARRDASCAAATGG